MEAKNLFSVSGADSLRCVVQKQDGRLLTIRGNEVVDFASCNYLGLDLDPELIDSTDDLVRDWGVHPGWARMFASPRPIQQLEEEIAEFICAPSVIVLPTISLIHLGAIRALAGRDKAVIVDRSAHKTIFDGAKLAESGGAKLISCDCSNPSSLEVELRQADRPAIVCVDGVYSMSGNLLALPELARICRNYGAKIYIDDAHGMGIIGESPSVAEPWGVTGNGCVRFNALDYDGIIYVSGFSKAFSSLCAFISCGSDDERSYLEERMSPYTYSGPLPTSCIATSSAALRINARRGTELRRVLRARTSRIISGAAVLGYDTTNRSGFPIVSLVIGSQEAAIEAANWLIDHGILVTLACYPLVPRDKCCLRISVTSAHTECHVDYLLQRLQLLREHLGVVAH